MPARVLLLSTTIMALGFPIAAQAASDAELELMAKRIQLLEQELQILKSQQNALAANQKIQNEATAAVNVANIEPAAGDKKELGLTLSSKGLEIKKDDETLMRIRGYVQADNRTFLSDDDDNGDDEFEIRRARLIVEGEIDDFYYRLAPEFGGASTQLYDAYIGYKPVEAADLRVGKFKPPVGLERLKSSTDLTFVENALPTLLTPNRDVGIQLGGSVLDKKLSYQAGVFNGVADDATLTSDDDDNKEFAARIIAEPVKGVSFGVAGTTGNREGTTGTTQLSAYRTPGRVNFFQYAAGSFADGQHWRIVPQASIYKGPFSLLGEYAISAQEVRNGANAADLEHEAFGVQAGWVLTGEDSSYKSISPANKFKPADGHWGAWEIAARYGELDIDNSAFPLFATATTSASEAQNAGMALNGYLNDHIKVQVDYQHTNFEGGGAAGTDRETEKAVLSRVGVKF